MRLRPALLSTLAIASVAVSAPAASASASPAARAAARCPFTFQVLHDDRIGSLRLPAGKYRLAASGMTCQTASNLFTQFLEDFDGVLPRPWKTQVLGVGKGKFTGGRASFTVTRTGKPSGGNDLACPGAYTLLHADRIGALVLKKGRYRIFLLSKGRLSCRTAANLLTFFLEDFDGHLSDGWVLLPESATFVRGSISYGFRIKPFEGKGGGGGHHSRGETRCPATFQVLHDDTIGKLKFPKGAYAIDVHGITCPTASRRFAQFLGIPSGKLPSPWVIDTVTGTFRTKGSTAFFQAKPAFRV